MNGFLLINKPKGITSFDVIHKLRKILGIRKIGHAGTLDPLATGLLIVAIGRGTKLLEYLIKQDKTYEAEIILGKISDSYDAEGEITHVSDIKIPLVKIEEKLKDFQGTISQIPPKYSALKINGKKACELMRKGKNVKMQAREITIYDLEVLDYVYPRLNLKIHCGTGTYIRSIAHDLGEKLKCGGYLTNLKRTKIDNYLLENAVDLADVNSEKILPLEWGAKSLTKLEINQKEAKKLQNGLQISYKKNEKNTNTIACFFEKKLISICKFIHSTKKLQPVKNFRYL